MGIQDPQQQPDPFSGQWKQFKTQFSPQNNVPPLPSYSPVSNAAPGQGQSPATPGRSSTAGSGGQTAITPGEWITFFFMPAIFICFALGLGILYYVRTTDSLLLTWISILLAVSNLAGVLFAYLALPVCHAPLGVLTEGLQNRLDNFLQQLPGVMRYCLRPVSRLKPVLMHLILSTLLNILFLLGLTVLRPELLLLLATPQQPLCGMCVVERDGQPIGISDGQYTFWQGGSTNNAERLIYLENERITRLDQAHIVTLAVATTLSGNEPAATDIGHYDLQGAYIAQREVNIHCFLQQNLSTGATICWYVRIIIANIGYGDDANTFAQRVALQIAQVAQTTPNFVGVMGWPFSTPAAIAGIKELADKHILMISPTASSDALTAISRYFLRVAPPNSEQGPLGAQYAESRWHARTAAIIYDSAIPYSETLATSFYEEFTKRASNLAYLEQYTTGNAGQVKRSLDAACIAKVDLIYFAGYTTDLNSLLDYLQRAKCAPQLHIMSGDAVYSLVDITPINFRGFSIYFTSFAYFDRLADGQNGQSVFRQDYIQSFFDPNRPADASPYGFSRSTSNGILAYDATRTLLNGAAFALNSPGGLKVDTILQRLLGALGTPPLRYQGASGVISLGPDGNPVNKTILVLCTSNGRIQQAEIAGQFQDGTPVETKPIDNNCS